MPLCQWFCVSAQEVKNRKLQHKQSTSRSQHIQYYNRSLNSCILENQVEKIDLCGPLWFTSLDHKVNIKVITVLIYHFKLICDLPPIHEEVWMPHCLSKHLSSTSNKGAFSAVKHPTFSLEHRKLLALASMATPHRLKLQFTTELLSAPHSRSDAFTYQMEYSMSDSRPGPAPH